MRNIHMSRKNFYDIQNISKGFANHRRIEMLFLLKKKSPLSTEDIVRELKINYQTGSMHVRKLVQSGLITSYPNDNERLHDLTPLGETVIKFLKII